MAGRDWGSRWPGQWRGGARRFPAPTAAGGQPQRGCKEQGEPKQAVRDYFGALSASDFKQAKVHSVGDVRVLAEWQRKMNEEREAAGFRPAAAVVESLELLSVEGPTAMVDIQGRLDEVWFDPRSGDDKVVGTDIGGSVTLVREDTAWLVADYYRDGQSVRQQVHRARGRQAKSGLVIQVIGLDIRKTGAVLLAEVRDLTALEADGENVRIITGSGRELKTNFPKSFIEVEIDRRSKVTVGFFFPKGHALKGAKQFRFQIEFLMGCGPGDPMCDAVPQFDFAVRVV